ncbi:MAG TPA: hypothetical protein VEX60_02295 [Pyrinomonadaceae bacterium]|nr:hypothetical protein [Pyrinomonadaceae bacterium]
MTKQQFIEEIRRLPFTDRIALLEEISRSLREDLENGDGASQEAELPEADLQPRREAKMSAVSRLRGIAKPDGPMPSDEELKEDYIRYLAEKYS